MPELPTGTVTFLFSNSWYCTVGAVRESRAALMRHGALGKQIVAEPHDHVVQPRSVGLCGPGGRG